MKTATPILPGLLLSLVALPAGAAGEVYKCRGADGGIAYQDYPCAGGTTEIMDVGSGGARRARARLTGDNCIAIARELWRLNATVNYTDQSAEGRARLADRRMALGAQCQLILQRSELASQCSQLERAINQAAGDGADALNRAGQQYDTICSEAAIDADMRRHIEVVGANDPIR